MALAYFAFGDRCQVRKSHVKDQRLTMELVLDNVGTWNVVKLGTHQHGQLCKHQLGTHTRQLWPGGTREAITISLKALFLTTGELASAAIASRCSQGVTLRCCCKFQFF